VCPDSWYLCPETWWSQPSISYPFLQRLTYPLNTSLSHWWSTSRSKNQLTPSPVISIHCSYLFLPFSPTPHSWSPLLSNPSSQMPITFQLTATHSTPTYQVHIHVYGIHPVRQAPSALHYWIVMPASRAKSKPLRYLIQSSIQTTQPIPISISIFTVHLIAPRSWRDYSYMQMQVPASYPFLLLLLHDEFMTFSLWSMYDAYQQAPGFKVWVLMWSRKTSLWNHHGYFVEPCLKNRKGWI